MGESRETRSRVSSYMFAPASASNDTWLTDREKELIESWLEIRKRMFRLFRYHAVIMAFILILIAAWKIYKHFI
jgi:ABC-type lipoprotein release transport system permease subunit